MSDPIPPELVRRYADAIMIAIKADIDAGIVPRSVSTFAELHDYVDANEYAGQAGVPWGSDPEARRYGNDGYALINAVEAAVSAMIAVSTRQLRPRLPEASFRATGLQASLGSHVRSGRSAHLRRAQCLQQVISRREQCS